MSVPDELRRHVVVDASRERVWQVLTEPDQLAMWFPTRSAEMDLQPGSAARFSRQDSTDEAIIDVVDLFERLVFRWRPEGLEDKVFGGTHVTLVESGFASPPDQIYEQSYEGNLKGWAAELAELKASLEAAA